VDDIAALGAMWAFVAEVGIDLGIGNDRVGRVIDPIDFSKRMPQRCSDQA